MEFLAVRATYLDGALTVFFNQFEVVVSCDCHHPSLATAPEIRVHVFGHESSIGLKQSLAGLVRLGCRGVAEDLEDPSQQSAGPERLCDEWQVAEVLDVLPGHQ